MNRMDWKRGRFDVDFETNDIHRSIRGNQSVSGDEVRWYRFLREESEMHDIYDQGVATGRIYDGPYLVPAWRVTLVEGLSQQNDTGFYFNNDLHVTLSWSTLERLGFTMMDIEHQRYLKDRIVYNGYVFRVSNVQVLGQVQQRDIIASVEATHVKPDEMVNDTQFREYVA
jgi:hypothetical protein